MTRYAIGDPHGRYDALVDLLKAVDYKDFLDELYVLGDITDYHDGVFEIVKLLKSIGSINIRGNHDAVFRYWIKSGNHLYNWSHGGQGTLNSFNKSFDYDFNFHDNMLHRVYVPKHIELFYDNMHDYYLTEDNIVLCHAGWNTDYSIHGQNPDEFYNNRSMYKSALKNQLDLSFHPDLNRVFIGHTITKDYKPFISEKLINLDTGAKLDDGYLTIMNIDTLEYKQSNKWN
ncbi:gp123 [Sphingomonas phage PAU]|uniref:NinI-like serine-threonine phosphatase n=1 Tax=Sphingomonas phage PAU TaxID=1150991 RepID=UPI000257326E|nr:NinI-like serine-threonine phosphatase [Sphingomonas phage PAU]AFF28121.1 gp123 [Sphingomonas phage PAU]